MTARCRATLRGPAQSAGTCRIATGAPENSLAQDDSATPILSPCCLHQRVRHLIYVMTPVRITAGINKAEDVGRMDAQIGLVDALRRFFLTNLASYLGGVVKMAVGW